MRVTVSMHVAAFIQFPWRSGRWLSGRHGQAWHLLLLGCVMLALTSCQTLGPVSPDLPPSTEPRFLPTLPALTLPADILDTEQRDAFAAADALRLRGERLQAREAFTHFVRRYPDSPLTSEALLALGHLALTLEQYEQALPAYRPLLERFPQSKRVPEAHLGLGIASYYQHDHAGSLTALRQYLALAPQGEARGLAHYYLGAAALKQQRAAEALPDLAAAQDSSSDPAVVQQAREHISTTVRQALTTPELVALAQRYAKTYPGDLLLERLGEVYRTTPNQAAEVEALTRLLTHFPQATGAQAARERLRALQVATPGGAPAARVTLGVLLPLSGAGASAGKRALHAIEIGLAQARERYPDLTLTLAVRDATQATATAQQAFRTLVDKERVIGVIGPLLSRMTTELAPLAGELGVPLMSPYARDSTFPAPGLLTLRNSMTDALQGRFLASYATGVRKLRRFAIVHPADAYGTALRDQFRTHVLQHQGEVVAVVSYPTKNANFSRLFAPLKGLRYDAIFLPEYADRVGTVVTQLAAANLKTGVQLLGSDGWNAPSLLARSGRLLEGAIFVDGFFADATTPAVQTFVAQFRKRHQEAPDLLAAQAYDTFLMCAQVLHAGAQTPTQLRDGLLQVRNFAGVSGLTSMRETGDADKELYVLTVKNGRIVPLEGAVTP